MKKAIGALVIAMALLLCASSALAESSLLLTQETCRHCYMLTAERATLDGQDAVLCHYVICAKDVPVLLEGAAQSPDITLDAAACDHRYRRAPEDRVCF